MRIATLLLTLAGIILGGTPRANAVGALAIGSCGATGGAWDYSDEVLAHGAAITNCGADDCQVVTTVRRACVAFALESNGCAWGWAVREQSRAAKSAAIEFCANAGGSDCSIRNVFCDTVGD
jgi:hypothetical protein